MSSVAPRELSTKSLASSVRSGTKFAFGTLALPGHDDVEMILVPMHLELGPLEYDRLYLET